MESHKIDDGQNILDELVILEKIKQKKNRNIQLMLLSDSEELKKLHYYIFSSADDVDYYTPENISVEELSMIYDMDIIINQKKDPQIREPILSLIQTHKLDLKFFEISDQKYLRQKDHLIAHNSGVHKLFEKEFMIEEYMMSIEMFLKTNFYTKRLLSLKENKERIIDSSALFKSRIKELLEKKIYFSLIKYNYESDLPIESYNIQKIIREYDTIYYDSKKGIVHFLILNTTPSFGRKLIEERMRHFSIYLEPITALSAFELVFEEE